MADDLLRQVAQRVASEGTDWLESLLASGRREEMDPVVEQPAAATRGPARERSRLGRKRRSGKHRHHGHRRRHRFSRERAHDQRSSSSSRGVPSSSSSSSSSDSLRCSLRKSLRPQTRGRRQEVRHLSAERDQPSQVVPPAGLVSEVQAMAPVYL